MKDLPLTSYPGRCVRMVLATTVEGLDGTPVLILPGEIVDVLWVCNRSKELLDVRVWGKLYVISSANLRTCGHILPLTHLELAERGRLQTRAA